LCCRVDIPGSMLVWRGRTHLIFLSALPDRGAFCPLYPCPSSTCSPRADLVSVESRPISLRKLQKATRQLLSRSCGSLPPTPGKRPSLRERGRGTAATPSGTRGTKRAYPMRLTATSLEFTSPSRSWEGNGGSSRSESGGQGRSVAGQSPGMILLDTVSVQFALSDRLCRQRYEIPCFSRGRIERRGGILRTNYASSRGQSLGKVTLLWTENLFGANGSASITCAQSTCEEYVILFHLLQFPVHSTDAPRVRLARCTAPPWPHEQSKMLAHANLFLAPVEI
jgi:hypothetical protein